MSEQLSISAAFSILAMAGLALFQPVAANADDLLSDTPVAARAAPLDAG
jgi:hypothetical protein